MLILKIFLVLILLILGWGYWRNLSPPLIGVVNGKLQPCPDTPNCVSSYAKDKEHFIQPFQLNEDGLEMLIKKIQSMKNVRIIEQNKDYLHAEFRSETMHLVDDLELLISPEEKVIHVRSAARVGYSDLGINRKRVEKLRR